MMRSDYCGRLTLADVGREVEVCGWVATRREQGKHLAFVDVCDHTGIIQCVVDGAHDLRSEYVESTDTVSSSTSSLVISGKSSRSAHNSELHTPLNASG